MNEWMNEYDEHSIYFEVGWIWFKFEGWKKFSHHWSSIKKKNWHHVMIFWVVTSCSDVVGYQCTDGPWLSSSGWRWRQQGPPKHWYPTTSLHGHNQDHILNHHHENLKSHTLWCHQIFFKFNVGNTFQNLLTVWSQKNCSHVYKFVKI